MLYLGKYNNISANQVNMVPAKTCPVFIGREYLKLMPSVVNRIATEVSKNINTHAGWQA